MNKGNKRKNFVAASIVALLLLFSLKFFFGEVEMVVDFIEAARWAFIAYFSTALSIFLIVLTYRLLTGKIDIEELSKDSIKFSERRNYMFDEEAVKAATNKARKLFLGQDSMDKLEKYKIAIIFIDGILKKKSEPDETIDIRVILNRNLLVQTSSIISM